MSIYDIRLFQATPTASVASTGGDSHAVRNIIIGSLLTLIVTVVAETAREILASRRRRVDQERALIDTLQETLSSIMQRTASLQFEFQIADLAPERLAKRESEIDGIGADIAYFDVLASRLKHADARAVLAEFANPGPMVSVDQFQTQADGLIARARLAITKLGEIRRKLEQDQPSDDFSLNDLSQNRGLRNHPPRTLSS
jgi:hypothetical protein